jgi:hypothetical protein
MDAHEHSAAERLLREALGVEWRPAAEIASVEELLALLVAAGVEGPVAPDDEDVDFSLREYPVSLLSSDAEMTYSYRLAVAHKLLRLAKAEKARRRDLGQEGG